MGLSTKWALQGQDQEFFIRNPRESEKGKEFEKGDSTIHVIRVLVRSDLHPPSSSRFSGWEQGLVLCSRSTLVSTVRAGGERRERAWTQDPHSLDMGAADQRGMRPERDEEGGPWRRTEPHHSLSARLGEHPDQQELSTYLLGLLRD